MIKAIKIYIPFFVVVSLFAGIFYGIGQASEKESNAAYDQDEEYPENMRPQVPARDEELEDELYFEEEEPVSIEDYVDFDIAEKAESEEAESEEEEPKQTKTESKPAKKVQEQTTEETSPTEEESMTDKVEIIPDRVNAREEPDSNSKILAVFDRGDDAVLVEEGKSWSIIRVGDSQGYVSNKLWKKM